MQIHPLPRHLAIIMDGNGRWAERRGLHRLEGHQQGARSVREVVRASRELGLEALTLYAFSAQNWLRPIEEVEGLMRLLREYLLDERTEIMENNIQLRAIGELHRLPGLVRDPLDALVRDSSKNTGMTLCLALSYGGRESIVEAARRLCEATARGALDPEELTEARFQDALETSFLPPVDLLIRTSGEERISNFLLWELAYAELQFVDICWPDFGRPQLFAALEQFNKRERRFGKTSSQVRNF